RFIADVSIDKQVAGIRCDGCEVAQVSRISQNIQIDDLFALRNLFHSITDESRTDEASAACDKKAFKWSMHTFVNSRLILRPTGAVSCLSNDKICRYRARYRKGARQEWGIFHLGQEGSVGT